MQYVYVIVEGDVSFSYFVPDLVRLHDWKIGPEVYAVEIQDPSVSIKGMSQHFLPVMLQIIIFVLVVQLQIRFLWNISMGGLSKKFSKNIQNA